MRRVIYVIIKNCGSAEIEDEKSTSRRNAGGTNKISDFLRIKFYSPLRIEAKCVLSKVHSEMNRYEFDVCFFFPFVKNNVIKIIR